MHDTHIETDIMIVIFIIMRDAGLRSPAVQSLV